MNVRRAATAAGLADDADLYRYMRRFGFEPPDRATLVGGPNLKLTLDESGQLVRLFAWADNLSINEDEGTAVTARVDGKSNPRKRGDGRAG